MTHHRSTILDLHFRNARSQSATLRAIAPILFLACTALCANASAQELQGGGHLSFGAERLFGFYLDKQHSEFDNGVESDADTTVVGIGWSLTNPNALLSIPRIGIDYFIDEHLTVGGSFGLASVSGDQFDALGVLFSGRVGYALRLTHAVSFWPRGGLTIATADDNLDLTVFGITLEGMFTLMPSDGWAFTAGPVIDLGFTGSGPGDDVDHSEILFGLMFGITGWLEL